MARFPHRFGEVPPGSLGVEEELFVVDSATLLPAPLPEEARDGERRKGELFREMVELTTPVVGSAGEAARELSARRAGAARALAPYGRGMLAAGTHPLATPGEQELTSDPLLARFVEYAGPAARIQYCCGLHVHVSVPSAEAAMGAIERALPWLPLLLALSANSPYASGEATGYESTRAEILTRLPRTGAPPAFESYDGWERFAGRLVDLGLADDYRRAWWDIRPHPRLGTVEIRVFDQPTHVWASAALAAAARALVVAPWAAPQADRAVYEENRFAAARFGGRAQLVHPDGERLLPVADLASELCDLLQPVAASLGDERELAGIRRLAARTQADEQHELAGAGTTALAAALTTATLD